MTAEIATFKIQSANLEDGIVYEVAREHINMQISQKVAEMDRKGTSDNPSDADIAELRSLVERRDSLGEIPA